MVSDDWREFANEVPTEPRSVVTFDGFTELCGWTLFRAESGEPDAWIARSFGSHTELRFGANFLDWKRLVGAGAKWRYIDPPGTESAEHGDLTPLHELASEMLSRSGRASDRLQAAKGEGDTAAAAMTFGLMSEFGNRLTMALNAIEADSRSAHPLAPFVARLTSEWTRLHVPSQDPGEIGSRDALLSLVAGLARWLKVEMPPTRLITNLGRCKACGVVREIDGDACGCGELQVMAVYEGESASGLGDGSPFAVDADQDQFNRVALGLGGETDG